MGYPIGSCRQPALPLSADDRAELTSALDLLR